ncbi:hypothetical protein [Paraliomyxa miuraensis]|uniref:hypothetical protein n=1 Tax=Paraliomyxa miuraensis TaxID=376150 RepID=UPI0022573FDD|nr:hypothetical protein [Paraliomyxa miuraensis]MCX4247091.1 hypothetical protein [Paraliomyxa miuraensis]
MRRIINTLGHSLRHTLGRTLGKTLIPALVALSTGTGCAAYKLEPPAGFAQVYASDYGAHMKANDNVGLRINVFDNVKGGTLPFWSRDLVEKLGKRSYALQGQSPVESKNGVVGTRFDFSYTPVGKDEPPRFYTAVLFVSDKHIVVLQLAGHEQHEARYSAEVDGILAELKVRGCKVGRKVCKGPQPDTLSTPAPKPAEGGEDEPADEEEAAPAHGEEKKAEPAPTTAMLEAAATFEPMLDAG